MSGPTNLHCRALRDVAWNLHTCSVVLLLGNKQLALCPLSGGCHRARALCATATRGGSPAFTSEGQGDCIGSPMAAAHGLQGAP